MKILPFDEDLGVGFTRIFIQSWWSFVPNVHYTTFLLWNNTHSNINLPVKFTEVTSDSYISICRLTKQIWTQNQSFGDFWEVLSLFCQTCLGGLMFFGSCLRHHPNWPSSFEGSKDRFSRMNLSKLKPLAVSNLLPLVSASSLMELSSVPFTLLEESESLTKEFWSKLKILFNLSIVGSMMSRNPITQDSSSTTSVRCATMKSGISSNFKAYCSCF